MLLEWHRIAETHLGIGDAPAIIADEVGFFHELLDLFDLIFTSKSTEVALVIMGADILFHIILPL
jgi:hypothetical protein